MLLVQIVRYFLHLSCDSLIISIHPGLLYITEEMCLLNRGQRDEDALLAAFNTTHGGNSGTSTGASGSASVYERPRFGTKNLFLVHHFAGSVTYSVTSWLDKNNDALQEDLLSLLMCSNNSFIQNAIVAVGMRTSDGENNITSGAEGQLGYVKEISEERLVAGVVEARAGQAQTGGELRFLVCIVLYLRCSYVLEPKVCKHFILFQTSDILCAIFSFTEEMSEEDSSAATAAYVNNAVAMRKARTASRRASLTVGSPGAGAGAGVERLALFVWCVCLFCFW